MARYLVKDMRIIDEMDAIVTVADFNNRYLTIEKVCFVVFVDSEISSFLKSKQIILARTMGTKGNAAIRAKILDLSKCLVHKIANAQAAGAKESPATRLYKALRIYHHRDHGPQHFSNTDSEGPTIRDRIQSLLRMTKGALVRVFSFDELASQREVLAKSKLHPSSAQSPSTRSRQCGSFAQGWANSPPRYRQGHRRPLLNCPLALLCQDMTDLLSSLPDRLDHHVCLEAYSDLWANGACLNVSPMTRADLLPAALCLGKHEAHADATNAALFSLITGGKRLENPDLWFAVLVLAIDKAIHDGKFAYLESSTASDSAPFSTFSTFPRKEPTLGKTPILPFGVFTSALSRSSLQCLSRMEVGCLADLVGPNLSEGDVDPHWTLYPRLFPPQQRREIVLSTMRPRYQLSLNRTWLNAVAEVNRVDPYTILPITRAFMAFAEKHGRYLTSLSEFMIHIWNRLCLHSTATTLPTRLVQFWVMQIENYHVAIATVPVNEAVKRYRESVKLDDRKRIEAETS
ncbi:hypothetical protein BDK51DRAFT_32822 [Blyttiomyces helicus]|uniref:Uncharacterized protein n=1 Tax=Blyttiomyces helicus TaxID=388810 RepID=A0A4P9WLW7_9FUNG|nr:hypothetical protein BDK51DRAFT_32822 [Blyttiomyces helicus]|eukprot:RKO93884.1 hypothetical protein BDK51DRAFT_32822 [Blyttiomyces helicus]